MRACEPNYSILRSCDLQVWLQIQRLRASRIEELKIFCGQHSRCRFGHFTAELDVLDDIQVQFLRIASGLPVRRLDIKAACPYPTIFAWLQRHRGGLVPRVYWRPGFRQVMRRYVEMIQFHARLKVQHEFDQPWGKTPMSLALFEPIAYVEARLRCLAKVLRLQPLQGSEINLFCDDPNIVAWLSSRSSYSNRQLSKARQRTTPCCCLC